MIKHAFLMSFALGVALVGFSKSSHAVIVESGIPAIFSFDTSGVGAVSLTQFSYSCPTSCGAQIDPNYLAAGASFDLEFGSTAGSDNLGTLTSTNTFGFAVNNLGSGITTPIAVPMSASEIFVSVLFVDDIFGIDIFGVSGIGFNLSGVLVNSPSAIPLPAALPLFAGGLGLMGLLGWRKKLAATA